MFDRPYFILVSESGPAARRLPFALRVNHTDGPIIRFHDEDAAQQLASELQQTSRAGDTYAVAYDYRPGLSSGSICPKGIKTSS